MNSQIPKGPFLVRRSLCANCPTPCAAQGNAALYGDPCFACPLPQRRFGTYGQCKPTTRARGLGDLVAAVAQPIAKAIDAMAGTDIKNCGGCAKRRDVLNRLLPLPPAPEKQPLPPPAPEA